MRFLHSYLILISISSLFFLPSTISWAHGPIHEKIKIVTAEIEKSPKDAALYIKRASYYRIDENFDLAFQDLQIAETLEPTAAVLPYHYAKLFAAFQYTQSALRFINRFLETAPKHIDGLMTRAALYMQAEQDSLAVIDFQTALEHTNRPLPEHYVNVAKAILQADSTNISSAIEWLEKGEKVLGFNIVLRSYAVDIAEKEGAYTEAIATIDGIIEQLPRYEKWLVRKAELQHKAKQYEEAYATYQRAYDNIRQLPKRNQQTRAVMELEAKVSLALIELQAYEKQ